MPLRALVAVLVCLLAWPRLVLAQAAPVGSQFKNGLIFVDVRVNGANGLFLLDTGAVGSVFDPRYAEAAGVSLGRPREIVGRGGDVAARQGEAVQLAIAGGPRAQISPVIT